MVVTTVKLIVMVVQMEVMFLVAKAADSSSSSECSLGNGECSTGGCGCSTDAARVSFGCSSVRRGNCPSDGKLQSLPATIATGVPIWLIVAAGTPLRLRACGLTSDLSFRGGDTCGFAPEAKWSGRLVQAKYMLTCQNIRGMSVIKRCRNSKGLVGENMKMETHGAKREYSYMR